MTERLYRDDPYLLEFEARVVSLTDHDDRPAVVLDRSAFYPESGGQPWDTGRLGEPGPAVVAVVERGDALLHVLDRPLAEGAAVRGLVDGVRRRDHRQQHCGQHLLSRALLDAAAARTLSFHLGGSDSTIDLDRDVDRARIRAAQARTNEIVWDARPVRVRCVSRAEAAGLGVDVKDAVGAEVRLVEAEGFDLQACGGTHPRSTAEVGVVVATQAERYKGGTRLHFACGFRALAAFEARQEAAARLGALLSAPFDELVPVAERTLARLAEAEKALETQRERLLDLEARELLAAEPGDPAIVVRRFEGREGGELRALAQRLVAASPCVALLGSATDRAHLVFAQSPGLGRDLPGLLREAVARLGGRGGGRGDLAQGGGERLDQLAAVLEEAAERARSTRA
jgi:alanyl-tRNA synthetase